MNYGPIIFLIAFLAFSGSWFGMVLLPQTQIGQLQSTNTLSGNPTYPVARAGMAQQGLQIYRAQGCAYCHSQQVRQSGTACDVMLNEVGTNEARVISALINTRPPGTTEAAVRELITDLPKTVTKGTNPIEGTAQVKALRAAGAKADLWIVPYGPDMARGYGKRHSVAADFLYDTPVLPGSIRVGPDLANVGARIADPNWHLRHLYAPETEVKGSAMPSYRYLFERRKIVHALSPNALAFNADAKIPAGYEIVPTHEARALVAYLTSLRVEEPLFEAPLTAPPPPPQPATNAPAGDTNAPAGATNAAALSAASTNAPATNSPPK